MNANEAVKEALNAVKKLIKQSSDSEEVTYRVFSEEFDAEIEGWEMRLQELDKDK